MVSHIFQKVISSPIVTDFRGLDVNCFEIVSAPINTEPEPSLKQSVTDLKVSKRYFT